MEKWHSDARRTADLLFAASPFKEHRADFNVWAIDTPAEESGVSRPSDSVYRRSPLRAAYDAFGSERYILTLDNPRLREIAAAAPYEFIEIVVNDRKYGGGGIFNVVRHRLGRQCLHALRAGTRIRPPLRRPGRRILHLGRGLWKPRRAPRTLGAQRDRRSASRQMEGSDRARHGAAHPVAQGGLRADAAGDPGPAPRDPRAHRPEEEMEALFREERESDTKLLASGPNAGKVGAFEGAIYEGTGYYRPQQDCIMFTRDEVGFCAVCRRAIERVIGMYAK